jgi:hypothetical protein
MIKLAKQDNFDTSLSDVDQLKAWQDIIGKRVAVGSPICNPFRNDTKPGCWLSWAINKSNRIVLNDFADLDYHGMTVIDAIMLCHKIDEPRDAIKYLRKKYPGNSNSNVKVDLRKKKHIIYKERKWNNSDKKFWNSFGISVKSLEEENVKAVEYFTVSDGLASKHWKPNLCYAFHVHISTVEDKSSRVKLYMPKTNGKSSWVTTCLPSDLWGPKNPSKDKAIITKSLKDLIILKKLLPDFDVYSVQNEQVFIPTKIREMFLENYEEIVLLYDNDSSGKKGAEKNKEVFLSEKVKVAFLDDEKDISDLYKSTQNVELCKKKLEIALMKKK